MRRFVTISKTGIVGILAIAVFVAVLSVASPASATVLNIDWIGNTGAGSPAYVGLGPAPDGSGNTTWNGLETYGSPSTQLHTDLVYSDGSAATGITILEDPRIGAGYRYGAGGLSLFDGFVDQSWDAAEENRLPSSITVGGLNDSLTYDVYVIQAHTWTSGYTGTWDVTVGGASQSFPGSGTVDSFVLDDNYKKFTGASSTGGELVIGWFGSSVDNSWVSGMQLVEIPEPSALCLLTGGLLGLLAYAWRKRR